MFKKMSLLMGALAAAVMFSNTAVALSPTPSDRTTDPMETGEQLSLAPLAIGAIVIGGLVLAGGVAYAATRPANATVVQSPAPPQARMAAQAPAPKNYPPCTRNLRDNCNQGR